MAKHDPRPATVAIVQQASLTPDIDKNRQAILDNIDRLAPDADFFVVTELSTTPYFAVVHDDELKTWAEKTDGEFVTAARTKAREHSCVIVLPLYIEMDGGKGGNVVLVIGPDGELVKGQDANGVSYDYYTKVHLPDAWLEGRGLDEPYYFEAGAGFPVFDTPLGKIGILVCYDRRFSEAWRSLALAGAEMVFVPSCVPLWNPGALASTADMFVVELRTHASENGVFVVACNRAGNQTLKDVESRFVGLSCVVDPAGGVLQESPTDEAAEFSVDVDLAEVTRVRKRLTLFRDRRPATYADGLNK